MIFSNLMSLVFQLEVSFSGYRYPFMLMKEAGRGTSNVTLHHLERK